MGYPQRMTINQCFEDLLKNLDCNLLSQFLTINDFIKKFPPLKYISDDKIELISFIEFIDF